MDGGGGGVVDLVSVAIPEAGGRTLREGVDFRDQADLGEKGAPVECRRLLSLCALRLTVLALLDREFEGPGRGLDHSAEEIPAWRVALWRV